MKNRIRIERRPAVGLGETWRGLEGGMSSGFLNWFRSPPPGGLATADSPVLEDWICFDNDRSELDDRAEAILGRRLKLLRADPAIRIVIGGLAERLGTISQSMRLGLKRVQSVRTFLLAAGIHPSRIELAVRGSGWSVTERSDRLEDQTSHGGELRLQVTDPRGTLARN
jgi:hypothetical protein